VDTPIKINQDANIFVSELDPVNGELVPTSVTYTLPVNRQAYLVCVEGSVSVSSTVNDKPQTIELVRHDAAEIVGPAVVVVTGTNNKASVGETTETKSQHSSGSHLLMVEMAKQGYGREDL
jgi:quercetin 2,3-dioxygenase